MVTWWFSESAAQLPGFLDVWIWAWPSLAETQLGSCRRFSRQIATPTLTGPSPCRINKTSTLSGYVKIAIEHGPVEIVDLPIKHGGSFHSYVSLPEGNTGKKKKKHIDPEVGFSFILTFISTFIVAIACYRHSRSQHCWDRGSRAEPCDFSTKSVRCPRLEETCALQLAFFTVSDCFTCLEEFWPYPATYTLDI